MKIFRTIPLLMTLAALSLGCSHDHDHDAHHSHEADRHADAEHPEAEAGHHEHAGEIHFSTEQAVAANLQLEAIAPAPFTGVIRVGGIIQSPLGEEQTIVATANGIISLGNNPLTEGSAVRAGQTLATISARKLQDGDAAEKSRLAFEAVQSEYQRAQTLVQEQIISQRDFEEVRLRFETARAAYEGQSANMTAHGISVASSISGYVKSLSIIPGDYVEVGTPLFTITQNRHLQLRAEVPENQYRQLRHVNSANFKVAYDDSLYRLADLHGRMLSYGRSSATDGAASGYLPVTFEFDNVGDLVPGTFADVYLLTQSHQDILSVPTRALTEEQGLHFVYVQVPDDPDAFLKREVSIGQDNGERTEILQGLQPGELVVVNGVVQVKLAAVATVAPEGHHH